MPLGVDTAMPSQDSGLVEWLIPLWTAKAIVSSVAQQRGVRRLIAQLKVLDVGASEFAVIDPTSAPFGLRVAFAPNGLPQLPRVGIVSSRLKRQSELEQVWLATLRAACMHARDSGQALLVVEGTAADRFVRRCGELFEIPTLVLRVGETSDEFDDWFERSLRDFAEVARSPMVFPVYVSPPLGISDFECQISNRKSQPADKAEPEAPERDKVLVQWSDRIVALTLRAGGNCDRLLRQRLSAMSPASVQLCGDERLVATRLSDELRTLGATTFGIAEETTVESVVVSSAKERSCAERKTTLISAPPRSPSASTPFSAIPFSPRDRTAADAARTSLLAEAATSGLFLTHWTRGLEAVALKELGDELLDKWLMQPETLDRSALGSLRRLVQERCLRGSRIGQRGVVRAVCFSAVPLIELMQRRTYRVHRTRWDCEPYGLCIRHELLQKLGARAVVYGDESDLDALPAEDRVWFQARYSQSKSETIDWSHEQEWRLPGDLDLSLLSASDAFVFVRTQAEVAQIEPLCDWPVVAMSPG